MKAGRSFWKFCVLACLVYHHAKSTSSVSQVRKSAILQDFFAVLQHELFLIMLSDILMSGQRTTISRKEDVHELDYSICQWNDPILPGRYDHMRNHQSETLFAEENKTRITAGVTDLAVCRLLCRCRFAKDNPAYGLRHLQRNRKTVLQGVLEHWSGICKPYSLQNPMGTAHR